MCARPILTSGKRQGKYPEEPISLSAMSLASHVTLRDSSSITALFAQSEHQVISTRLADSPRYPVTSMGLPLLAMPPCFGDE